jgi:hypothetical protein
MEGKSKNLHVYIVSSPFYNPNSGDQDFIEGQSKVLESVGIKADYVTPTKENVAMETNLRRLLQEASKRGYKNLSEFGTSYIGKEKQRKWLVESILNQVISSEVSPPDY